MLAYAFSTEYQNSNQWVLETYAAASSEFQVDQRGKAQAWLKLAGLPADHGVRERPPRGSARAVPRQCVVRRSSV
jgi:hypothetical protein